MNEQGSSGAFLQQDSAVDWLRLCTLLLAAVSFWATAQGMSNYVFSEGWQAYAASLAVQGILVGLNFYLPSFWRRISGMAKFWLGILTIVVLLCSSWFSFIYTVERVYRNSWGVESRLLVQSSYRRELFSANDYVDAYSEYLNEHLSTQVHRSVSAPNNWGRRRSTPPQELTGKKSDAFILQTNSPREMKCPRSLMEWNVLREMTPAKIYGQKL